jgi:hypothetical protein
MRRAFLSLLFVCRSARHLDTGVVAVSCAAKRCVLAAGEGAVSTSEGSPILSVRSRFARLQTALSDQE